MEWCWMASWVCPAGSGGGAFAPPCTVPCVVDDSSHSSARHPLRRVHTLQYTTQLQYDRAGQSPVLARPLAGRRRHRDRQSCINGRVVRNIQWPMHACRLQVIPHRDGVPPTISCGPSAITLPVTHSPWPWNPCLFCPRCTKLLSLSHANAARSHMHCTCRAPLAAPHRGLSNISTRPILDRTPFTHPALLRRKHHGPILITTSLPLCPSPFPLPPRHHLHPHCPPRLHCDSAFL